VASMNPYADAAGLIERSAAAFTRSIPDVPGEGYFGPGSVAWRVSADLSSPVAGLRALLIQALHPLAMAGVDQHSDWRSDPVGRLAATSAYLATVFYGERATADRAAARVRRVHERVTGIDPETGHSYAASDPALLLWVHAALVDSGIAGCAVFGDELSPAEADDYVEEMTAAAMIIGIPAHLVPSTVAELARYLESVRPELRCSAAAKESMAYLLDPPGLDEDMAEIWQDIREAAVVSLPEWARELYGYQAPALTAMRRNEIRQALGVLDAVYIGEPGVLEARQRIMLRSRAVPARGDDPSHPPRTRSAQHA
jgi:uncharacterized protein (DUF2236 family)